MTALTLPKVCVIGAGAIGGFFGARLAQGWADVSVVARGATLEALQKNGWLLESAGQRQAAPVRAVADTVALGLQDVVIIAVKSYALASVAPMVKPLLGPQTIVIPALNGVPWWFTQGAEKLPVSGRLASADADGTIDMAIPSGAVLGAVVYPACSSPEPGMTRHNSGSKVVFGEPGTAAGAEPTARLQAWISLLQKAGFDAEASTDIRTEVWKKLLGNACFNPVSMITGSATDLMIDDPNIYRLFTVMMGETLAVGQALGIDPGIQVADRIALTRKLGNVKTSMLQDSEAGRGVEIDAILGAVSELGRKTGVATPALDTVFALAHMRARTFGLLKA
ncbi:ketopantoate reductase family protein [Polaromonas sp.]|uniref:ketopantoate reductase family protein n=1 Tax=Polaromonas sp. TaxID=1869339 RepID=UPI003BAA3170